VITVLFADLRGFTAASETMAPEDAQRMVNEFLAPMIHIAREHEATVDKLVGDEIMLLFGAPLERADHAVEALRTALDMRTDTRRSRPSGHPRGGRRWGWASG